MRIIAGEFRGRAIEAPRGEGTRPTTDRVREALMSSLSSRLTGFDGQVVLDAFAGSGALGLEALSRGARFAEFFDRDRAAQAAIARNMAKCGLGPSRAQLAKRDFMRGSVQAPAGPYTLAFLDPPYADDAAEVLARMAELAAGGILAAGATVVYEHARTGAAAVGEAAQSAGFDVLSARNYGKTGVTYLAVRA